jgi:hypothetical protein
MMPGSLLVERKFTRWSRADSDAYLTSLAIGLLAGIAVTYLRTPLHLPGHKVLLWMVPALACRMKTQARAGAATSALGTVAATILLDGQLGGGFVMMPLVVVAGLTLDIAARAVERRGRSAHGVWNATWSALTIFALAGMAGNLICFIKRLFDPAGPELSAGGIHELIAAAGSYAFFGFLAGALGGACGLGICHYAQFMSRKREENHQS